MHLEILDEHRINLLKSLVGMPETEGFYLAGGTALSLQLGLRESFDFDFFIERRFNSDALLALLKERLENITLIHLDRDTCDVSIGGIQTSFMRYPYPLVSEPVVDEVAFGGLTLCNPEDIAVMKLSAIGSRGARKDFYDLYQIYRMVPGFSSEKLLRLACLKFGEERDLTYMIAGLSFFDDAEGEELPRTFVRADWEAIQQFFRKEQAVLFDLYAKRF